LKKVILARGRQLIVVALGITTLVFFLARVSGDPALLLAGPDASEELLATIRTDLGLDDPVLVQYGRFLGDLARLDFGDSFRLKTPAMDAVLERLPLSLLLAGTALVISFVVGVPAGLIAAVRRGKPSSRIVMGGAMFFQSAPGFVVGIVLILVFAARLGWFPTFGSGTARHLVLPAVTLAAGMTARQVRLVQAYALEELASGYVRTCRSLGYSERRIRYRHILRNVMVPLVSLLGIEFGLFIAGAVITEAVFSWPGLGRLMVTAVTTRDYPVIQAGVFVIGVLVVFVNFLVDLTYQFIDPRLRTKAS
jgi:peptide/nickel transport system permease protein